MEASNIALILVSGMGVLHGLCLSGLLWIYRLGNSFTNRVLAVLLLVMSFRVGKSVLLEFTPDLSAKIIFVGLATLMSMGPLFLLFVNSILKPSKSFHKIRFLHFLPTVLGMLFGFWIEEFHLETLPVAFFGALFAFYYLHYLTYLIRGFWKFRKYKDSIDPSSRALIQWIFYGLLLIWFVYVLNLFDEVVPYVLGPILYTIIAYLISLVIIQKSLLSMVGKAKYQTTSIASDQQDQLYSKLVNHIEEELAYRNVDLTLKSLSELLKVSPQALSMVVNEKSGHNFNQFINEYRINEAKSFFGDPSYANRTIASVAFEVGFNSLSSFNKAFKTVTGTTPKSYRDGLSK